jgi:hypothetical protein
MVFDQLIIDERQLKQPFWLTVLPDDYLPFFGLITVLWGTYEDMFDEFLGAMVRQSGKQPGPGWERLQYKARIKTFKKQAKICFKQHEPLLAYIQKMCADSKPIHNERNILTHGRIAAYIPEGRSEEIIEAKGYIKKKQVSILVNQTNLVRLYHELGHLTGRVQFLLDPHEDMTEEEYGGPFPLEQPERSALQDFWSRNRQILASEHKPARPRRASRG